MFGSPIKKEAYDLTESESEQQQIKNKQKIHSQNCFRFHFQPASSTINATLLCSRTGFVIVVFAFVLNFQPNFCNVIAKQISCFKYINVFLCSSNLLHMHKCQMRYFFVCLTATKNQISFRKQDFFFNMKITANWITYFVWFRFLVCNNSME